MVDSLHGGEGGGGEGRGFVASSNSSLQETCPFINDSVIW